MAETFIFSLFTNTEGDTVGNRRERKGMGARGGGLGGALRGLGLLWQHNKPNSCDACPCSYPLTWIVDGRNGARRKQHNEKIDHGNMAVLIDVRRPGRQQHKEKTDHGNMGGPTDVKRPGQPRQRRCENRQ